MTPIRRVAVVQWYIKDLAIEENHSRACQYIRDAAGDGAELVVLPEYHLNGFAPGNPLYIHQTENYKPYLTAYQNLAKELAICLVPAYFISSTGSILSSYRKKNIWHPERAHLTSSTHEPHEVFDTPIGKVGLLICWDLAFPEAFRELIAKGAEVIIIPTFWSRYDASPAALSHNHHSESLLLTSLLTTRAFENTCGIIFANVASGPGDHFLGLSRVTLPIVGVVREMGNEEGVLVVDMDLELIKVAEDMYRVREDLGRDGWHYIYRHNLLGKEDEGARG